MNPLYHPWLTTLAQVVPPTVPGWDDAEPTPPPKAAPPSINFSDLQQGMRQWRSADSGDSSIVVRNWLLGGVAAVAVILLLIHMRQRWKARKSEGLDSELALFRELTRGLALPWGSTLILYWMARSGGVSVTSLLISPSQFRAAMEKWSAVPTFALVRRMAAARVRRLDTLLFG